VAAAAVDLGAAVLAQAPVSLDSRHWQASTSDMFNWVFTWCVPSLLVRE
jgi:hypothetical protein